MLLRAKCTCGKLLEIPAACAGRKLSCPACKRTLTLSPEKFQATEAGAQPAEQPETSPAPAPPQPALIELEHAPIKPESAAVELDLVIPPVPSGSELPPAPEATAVTTAAPAGYAVGGSVASRGGRLDMDVISPPTQSFWADALAAFGYPFLNTGNVVTFAIIIFIYCLEMPLISFRGLMGLRGFSVLLIFFIEAWIAAIYLTVVLDTAAGSTDLPDLSMQDRGGACVRYLSAFACALLPASCYFILLYFNLLPPYLQSSANLAFLIAAGIFFTPLYLILFAFNATNMVYRVDLIFTTVFRTWLPYLSLWGMLLLVGIVKILPLASLLAASAGLNISVPTLPAFGGIFGQIAYDIIDIYLGIVAMRLIGLYYLHFKRRFTLVME